MYIYIYIYDISRLRVKIHVQVKRTFFFVECCICHGNPGINNTCTSFMIYLEKNRLSEHRLDLSASDRSSVTSSLAHNIDISFSKRGKKISYLLSLIFC